MKLNKLHYYLKNEMKTVEYKLCSLLLGQSFKCKCKSKKKKKLHLRAKLLLFFPNHNMSYLSQHIQIYYQVRVNQIKTHNLFDHRGLKPDKLANRLGTPALHHILLLSNYNYGVEPNTPYQTTPKPWRLNLLVFTYPQAKKYQ